MPEPIAVGLFLLFFTSLGVLSAAVVEASGWKRRPKTYDAAGGRRKPRPLVRGG